MGELLQEVLDAEKAMTYHFIDMRWLDIANVVKEITI